MAIVPLVNDSVPQNIFALSLSLHSQEMAATKWVSLPGH